VSHVELASEPLDLAAGFERMASFALNGVGARPSAR